jgi:hypothetical protein
MKIAISKKHLSFIGASIGLVGFITIWIFYGWILALSILFCVWGNNIERSSDIIEIATLLTLADQQKRKQQ